MSIKIFRSDYITLISQYDGQRKWENGHVVFQFEKCI